jgi:hypothetical protein
MPISRSLGAVALILVLATCSHRGVGANGTTVGADCRDDRDCLYICAEGDRFPGGMCTVPCGSDDDCPFGTSCVDEKGGICGIDCFSSRDCDGLGFDYGCDEIKRHGAGGKTTVCIGPPP